MYIIKFLISTLFTYLPFVHNLQEISTNSWVQSRLMACGSYEPSNSKNKKVVTHKIHCLEHLKLYLSTQHVEILSGGCTIYNMPVWCNVVFFAHIKCLITHLLKKIKSVCVCKICHPSYCIHLSL